MTARRVRPNGLVAGQGHPPIFFELLHSRKSATEFVYPAGGAVLRLASRLHEYPKSSGPRMTFGEVVRVNAHEVFGLAYFTDEGSDSL